MNGSNRRLMEEESLDQQHQQIGGGREFGLTTAAIANWWRRRVWINNSSSRLVEEESLDQQQQQQQQIGGGGEFGLATAAAVSHVVAALRGGWPFVPSISRGFTFQKSSDIQKYIFFHHHPHHIIPFLIILTMSVSSLGCLLKFLLCRWREDLVDNLQHQQVLGSPLEHISCASTNLPSKDSSQPCSSIWTMDLLF